jgi:hypothetical protein
MKRIYLYSILCLALACMACGKTKKEEGVCGIIITDSGVQVPRWLVDTIENSRFIEATTGGIVFPWVYGIWHNEQEYIFLYDPLTVGIDRGSRFFTCFGKLIRSELENFELLQTLGNVEACTLLWRCPIVWGDYKGDSTCNEIVATQEKVLSPQWLANEMERAAHCPTHGTGRMIYPWLYSVSHKEQEYILLTGMPHSDIIRGYRFFTCYGKRVEANPSTPLTGLYWDLLNESSRTLLWRQYDGMVLPISITVAETDKHTR